MGAGMSFGKRNVDLTQHGGNIFANRRAHAGPASLQALDADEEGVNLFFYTAMYYLYAVTIAVLSMILPALFLFIIAFAAVLFGFGGIISATSYSVLILLLLILLVPLNLFGGVLATSYHFIIRQGRAIRDNERKLLVAMIILTGVMVAMVGTTLLFLVNPQWAANWQFYFGALSSGAVAATVIGNLLGFALGMLINWILYNFGFGWLTRKVFANRLAYARY